MSITRFSFVHCEKVCVNYTSNVVLSLSLQNESDTYTVLQQKWSPVIAMAPLQQLQQCNVAISDIIVAPVLDRVITSAVKKCLLNFILMHIFPVISLRLQTSDLVTHHQHPLTVRTVPSVWLWPQKMKTVAILELESWAVRRTSICESPS